MSAAVPGSRLTASSSDFRTSSGVKPELLTSSGLAWAWVLADEEVKMASPGLFLSLTSATPSVVCNGSYNSLSTINGTL